MVLSMTGFGKAKCVVTGKQYSVEIKTLNSKSLDLNFKIPPELREKEIDIRKQFSDAIIRGKVELYFLEEKNIGGPSLLNLNWIEQAYRELQQFTEQRNMMLGDVLPSLLRMNEATKAELSNLSENDLLTIDQTIQDAISSLQEFRKQEGNALEKDLVEKINLIQKFKKQLEPFEQPRINRLHEKIKEEIKTLVSEKDINKDRLEQEMIYYIEKLDINEEKVRLDTHCQYFLEVLDEKNAEKGKKLGFISQEIGREINTIGSKANDADMQKIVVLMKDELEKIKEQVNNVL
jgi:uncharacterized protein (TIGR00255 family)